MAIAVIGMVDEREEALRLVIDRIAKKGHRPMLIDISIGTGAIASLLQPHISAAEIAAAGGTTLAEIKAVLAKERDQATESMADGLGNKLRELLSTGDLEGVMAVGGMTGTFISLSAMKHLPFGLPKLLVSSVAAMPAYAKKLAEFFAVRDITVMHSVVDTVGMNALVRNLMLNAAGAICGMVEAVEPDLKDEKPAVAITEFGFCDQCARYVRERLETNYNIISFHATGLGEKAAVDLVGQGLFEAFIDLVPSGFSEYLLGGNRAAGDDRLDAGGRLGRPYILTPCGFDMISCGPIQRRDQDDPLWTSRNLAERKLFLQDALRVQARTGPAELKLVAQAVAEKLNRHQNKKRIKFVVPARGFSSLSGEGASLHDPEADQAFLSEFRTRLDPEIEIIEVSAHINTAAFADAVVSAFENALKS